VWGIRYLWIQHRFDNEGFLSNYFLDNSSPKINVRKSTVHLSADWNKHNSIFLKSQEDGNLVWRYKVLNSISRSIDYVEVWKSIDVIERYFNRTHDVIVPTGEIWGAEPREQFAKELWNSGFDIRTWIPYNTISRDRAEYYYNLIPSLGNCILNTKWNRNLNP
jgi:hypothetical protein